MVTPMHHSWIRFTLFMALAGWSVLALAAGVTATLDRERLVEGETVTLVLQTDDPRQSLDVDLEPLAADFAVLDQRTETQMSIVNGRQSAMVRQLVTLEPKRSGRLQIPPLQVKGGDPTPPLTLVVDPAPQPAPGEAPAVFLELELDPADGPYYVHAQLSLKVRIFYQQNLTEAGINPPEPAQASVRLLDEVPYQADRNGERYRVLERHYAIFPERSGELVIPPLQLTGRLIERPADRLWQPSVRGRRVRVESEALTLAVQPRPAAFSGASWLPARRIDLAQQITDGESIRVGEPVTRTVIVDAVGLEEHMLEEPAWPDLENARIYPDQPQGISRDDGQWVLGHREFRYAVVPEQPGTLVLPELRLAWWDTVNDRERVAVLPSHQVEVLPSELASQPPVAPTAGSGPAQDLPVAGGRSGGLAWQLASIVFALLWLATLGLYLRARRAAPRPDVAGAVVEPNEQLILMALRKACRANDAREARRQLASWVRHYGPDQAAGSMLGLARVADAPALAAAIRQLDQAGFQAGGEPWQGAGLMQAFESWRKTLAADARAPAVDEFDLYAAAR